MSVRLSMLAAATLALGACDGTPLQPAATRTAACCCTQCPTGAAPAARAPDRTTQPAGVVAERVSSGRKTYARTGPRVSRASRSYGYRSDESAYGYGGRYGARGRSYGGVSVSVEESESSSERYSYSESSSGYGSASGYGYAYGSGGARTGGGLYADGRASRHPPHHPGYRLAGVDRDGYLTWPGKVED